MGAHLLSLRELAPTLVHLAGNDCRSLLLHTRMGTLMLSELQRLARQVELSLRRDPESELAQSTGVGDLDASSDLSTFPGYADMGVQHHLAEERDAGVMMWSRVDIGPPVRRLGWDSVPVRPVEAEVEETGALRGAVVALLSDLRNGLRIESRHRRDVPTDLDARLFGPLDGAIKRRRERMRRLERQKVASATDSIEQTADSRVVEPSVGAGPMGPPI